MEEKFSIARKESQSAEESAHLRSLSKKMLTVFQKLKEQKTQSGRAECDAELCFIEKMIREFEADLRNQPADCVMHSEEHVIGQASGEPTR